MVAFEKKVVGHTVGMRTDDEIGRASVEMTIPVIRIPEFGTLQQQIYHKDIFFDQVDIYETLCFLPSICCNEDAQRLNLVKSKQRNNLAKTTILREKRKYRNPSF